MSKKLIKKSQDKVKRYARRKHRSNVTIKNTANPETPRLIVNKSNAHMQAQIVDLTGKVLAFANSFKIEKGSGSEKAFAVGEALAKLATKNGVSKVVFDRNGHLYHGRVKQLAEGARSAGLDF